MLTEKELDHIRDGYAPLNATSVRAVVDELREARRLLREARLTLENWHREAKGHHPDESCCDVTEAIDLLAG